MHGGYGWWVGGGGGAGEGEEIDSGLLPAPSLLSIGDLASAHPSH